MKFLQNIKMGFTLAEVLITLVIIGIIAAMTIPTLMNNTNKQEYVSRLKKAYSTLSQVTNRIIAEQGNPRGDIGGWATTSLAVYEMYKKYLSKVKDCNTSTGCMASEYKRMNNQTVSYDDASSRRFVLADGTSVLFHSGHFSNSCEYESFGSSNVCQIIAVDINGKKGPNALGTDAFAFAIKEYGLVPVGCDSYGCGSDTVGWGCTCKVLREGAINY